VELSKPEMIISKGTNVEVEFSKDYSTYSDSVMIGGQQPVLKRIMRDIADVIKNDVPKIDLTVIG